MRNRVAYGANAGGAWLRIAAALLALSSMGAGAPVGGPEVTVCEDTFGEEFLQPESIRVAGGAHGYIVACSSPAELGTAVIRATRLTSSGAADAGGITLAETLLSGSELAGPALAAGANGYLAVWGEQRSTEDDSGGTVYGAALVPPEQGSLPVPAPSPVGSAPLLVGAPAVASAGDRYLVVWREPTRVHGRWVSAAGAPIEASFQVSGDLAKPVATEGGLAVACTGGACMVAWEDVRESEVAIYAASVGDNGPGAEVPIAQSSASAPYGLSLASDVGGFLLVWASDVLGSVEMSAALLDSSGAPQSPIPASLQGLGHAALPALASSAEDQHLVTWVEEGGFSTTIHGAVLGTTGGINPLTSTQDLAYTGNYLPPASIACASAGEPCWLAYAGNTEHGSSHAPIVGTQVSPTLGAPPEGSSHMQISTRVAAQDAPEVACGRSGLCLATWREPNQAYDQGGQVVAALLTPTSAESLVLKSPDMSSDMSHVLGFASVLTRPVVVSNQLTPEAPAHFLAAWIGDPDEPVHDWHQIVIAVVNENGIYQDTLGAESNVEKIGPAVASDGEQFVVVWAAGGANGLVIRGARVGLDGSVPGGDDQGGVLVTGVQTSTPPSVVYDGEGFLLVWQMSDGLDLDIYGLRLDTSGATLAPAGEPFRITKGLMSPNSGGLGVASEGRGVSLVAWKENESVRAVRVSASGARLSDLVEIASGSKVHGPRVVFDGQVYLVSWRDGPADDAQVRGTWIGQDGAVLAPEGFTLTDVAPTPAVPGFAEDMTLGSDGAGRALLALVRRRFDDGEGYVDLRRIRARLLGSPCAFGDSPVSCVESECRTAGWCDPAEGACAGQVPKADGTACQGGLCVAGQCVADPPMDSTSGTGGTGGGAAAADDGGSGCGCRVGATGSGGWPAAAAALGALAWLGRRRRDR